MLMKIRDKELGGFLGALLVFMGVLLLFTGKVMAMEKPDGAVFSDFEESIKLLAGENDTRGFGENLSPKEGIPTVSDRDAPGATCADSELRIELFSQLDNSFKDFLTGKVYEGRDPSSYRDVESTIR